MSSSSVSRSSSSSRSNSGYTSRSSSGSSGGSYSPNNQKSSLIDNIIENNDIKGDEITSSYECMMPLIEILKDKFYFDKKILIFLIKYAIIKFYSVITSMALIIVNSSA